MDDTRLSSLSHRKKQNYFFFSPNTTLINERRIGKWRLNQSQLTASLGESDIEASSLISSWWTRETGNTVRHLCSSPTCALCRTNFIRLSVCNPLADERNLTNIRKTNLQRGTGGSSSIDFFSFWLFIDRPPLGAKTAARNAPCRPPPKMFGTRLANIFLLLKQRPRGAG